MARLRFFHSSGKELNLPFVERASEPFGLTIEVMLIGTGQFLIEGKLVSREDIVEPPLTKIEVETEIAAVESSHWEVTEAELALAKAEAAALRIGAGSQNGTGSPQQADVARLHAATRTVAARIDWNGALAAAPDYKNWLAWRALRYAVDCNVTDLLTALRLAACDADNLPSACHRGKATTVMRSSVRRDWRKAKPCLPVCGRTCSATLRTL